MVRQSRKWGNLFQPYKNIIETTYTILNKTFGSNNMINKFNKTVIYRNSENQLNEAISQGYLQLRSKHYQLSYFTLRYQQVKQAKTSANI